MKDSEKENQVEDSHTDSSANDGQADETQAGDVAKSEELSPEQALHAAEQKASDNWDQLLRTKAEMENLRRRNSRDIEDAHKFALERFINDLLPVRDSMEMGLDAATETVEVDKLKEGMDLTLKMMISSLEKVGLVCISPEIGEKLNPELHQAMSMQEEPNAQPNTILMVMQKGYSLNERLIRPAMVIVAKALTTKEIKASSDENPGSGIDEKA